MHINTRIIINRPREQVWEYFSTPENLHSWIGGLKAYHHVSGEPGTISSKGIYEFEEHGKIVEMREQVLHCKEPAEFSNSFSHKDFDMITNYTFFVDGKDKTAVICNTEYRFKKMMWKLFSHVIKAKMQKRQNEDLKRLKTFVEMAPVHHEK